ncbi:MAG TPA: polysaccharide deacetylase family protein [Candidatus Solibacter sp.]|nr:polysaccharide deacetylase family protein [Candidatus Solibacter sp.]
MKRFVFNSFSKSGGDQLLWKLSGHRLRILCYHGICEDRLAVQPWMPHFFVTATDFQKQLEYLLRSACVLPLHDAIIRLRDGSLPPRSVAITFDDGYANNFHLAYPLLQKYRLPATIFLSSAYMVSGEIYPFLKLKLIRLHMKSRLAADALPEYKSSPLDLVVERAERWWPEVREALAADQLQTLRPMTIEEVKAMTSPLIEFGAHTHTHCILKNESRERREEEILTSIQKVAEWTGSPVRLFSYPNGQSGDFGQIDKNALRAQGIEAAVSGMGGANSAASDRFELRRYPVGMFHDDIIFRAEVSGFRNVLNTTMGRLGL